ncbi:MAG: hypothetical protein LBB93_06140 [Elusimicrobiota bacterium]|jgi:hypothetical protein|nr:hypothetical protein [Elusimicrobiota bacterium]
MKNVGGLIDELGKKQQESLKNLKKLKEENTKLSLELSFLRQESEKNRKIVNSYEVLKKKVENTIVKIERLLKKIDSSND